MRQAIHAVGNTMVRVDHALQLSDLVEEVVYLLTGFGTGQGGGQAGPGLIEPLELEQAGFEVVFEGGE